MKNRITICFSYNTDTVITGKQTLCLTPEAIFTGCQLQNVKQWDKKTIGGLHISGTLQEIFDEMYTQP